MVAGFGVQSALLLDAVSFYAIAWILFTAGPLPHAEPEPGRLRERVRAGARLHPRQRHPAAPARRRRRSAFVFFSAVIPIEVVYAKETLGAGDTGYGVLLGSWGVGMVLGSLVFARLRRASLPLLLLLQHARRSAAGYLGHGRRPDPRRRLRRLGRSAAPATACSGSRWSAPCRS